jgi:UDP-N-acetylglucosamine/UDP-N-acetylgalactosamine diphosphorylase
MLERMKSSLNSTPKLLFNTSSLKSVLDHFHAHHQGHIFRFWETLNSVERTHLLNQAGQIDLQELESIIACLPTKLERPLIHNTCELRPAQYVSKKDPTLDWKTIQEKGAHHIRSGKVAAFTVAGGLGSRLGVTFPKGTLPVTLIKNKSLFQLFAEKIKATKLYYHTAIPWTILTSPLNHTDTIAFFKSNDFFGLDPQGVHFIRQGLLPALDINGKILLENKHTLALYPNGHGGTIQALLNSNVLAYMNSQRIETLSYFQVDNPLIPCIDPIFIGLHIEASSEMSSKIVTKEFAEEKVGVFCQKNNKLVVVEYVHLPPEMANLRDTVSGQLCFAAGNIAVHLLETNFLERISTFNLPVHFIPKCIPSLDANGHSFYPSTPNAFKLERFIFDALPLASNTLLLEVDRKEEFSAIKNASGTDSTETAQAALLELWQNWVSEAEVPNSATESKPSVPVNIEISPLFAHNQTVFNERWKLLKPTLPLSPNCYLE